MDVLGDRNALAEEWLYVTGGHGDLQNNARTRKETLGEADCTISGLEGSSDIRWWAPVDGGHVHQTNILIAYKCSEGRFQLCVDPIHSLP